MVKFSAQIKHHSVALISLAIALSSLAYNTWRNEQTEENRNIRAASFEILLKLGELEQVVFFSHYDKDLLRGNPRAGWAYILTIKDLGTLTLAPARGATGHIYTIWKDNWQGLGNNNQAVEAISAAIDQTRQDTLQVLSELD